MGHMNATKRLKRESKRRRDDDALREDTVVKVVNLAFKSIAISLYELYGFHNVRTGRVLQDALDRVEEYNEKFDPDCAEAAMDLYLRDLGLNMVLKEKH